MVGHFLRICRAQTTFRDSLGVRHLEVSEIRSGNGLLSNWGQGCFCFRNNEETKLRNSSTGDKKHRNLWQRKNETKQQQRIFKQNCSIVQECSDTILCVFLELIYCSVNSMRALNPPSAANAQRWRQQIHIKPQHEAKQCEECFIPGTKQKSCFLRET